MWQVGVQNHNGLGCHGANLGAAKTQQVHPGIRGELAVRRIQRSRGICQTGAIQVQKEVVGVSVFGKCADLVGGVNGTELGGVTDADHTRLGAVHKANVEQLGGNQLGS